MSLTAPTRASSARAAWPLWATVAAAIGAAVLGNVRLFFTNRSTFT